MIKTYGANTFGTGSGTRSLGKPAARYPGAVATDSDLIIGVDRQQTTLLLPLTSFATSMTVLDASMITAYNLLSVDNELVKTTGPPAGNVVPIQRGFDGTTPAAHSANAAVTGFVDAYHHNGLVAEVEAIETFLGPNGSNLPSPLTPATATTLGGVKIGPGVTVQTDGTISVGAVTNTAYTFAPQTPGGSLTVGANSIPLSPMPAGLAVGNYLYVSGGTGAAEAVQITGVSASSIIVTCANAHSGAWTIQTATGGVQEAMVVAANMGLAGTPLLEVQITTMASFYAVANVPTVATWLTISLRGQGKTTISIERNTSYRNGSLLFYNGTSSTNQIGFEIHDMEIMDGAPDHSWFPNSGTSAVHIKNALACNRVIDNVSIVDSNTAIDLEGSFAVEIHNTLISWGPNPSVKPVAGLFIHGINSILGNPGSIITISDLYIDQTPGSTNGNQAQAGISISCVDGVQISNSAIIQTDYGVVFNSSLSTDQIDGVLCDMILIDANKINNFAFGGSGTAYFGDIAIRNCSMTMWASTAAPPTTLDSGISISSTSQIQTLEITDNLITTSGLSGIYVAGKNIKKLLIAGNRITDCNARLVGYPGIEILPGATNVLIQGNTIGNTGQFVGVMPYGVSIDASGGTNNLTIVGNDLRNNNVGPINIVNGVPANLVFASNGGIDDVIPTVASAASIAAPSNPVFQVSGTTTVMTMTGGWMGARKTIVKIDAGSVTIGGGGNIPTAHTVAQNQSLILTWNGTSWL